MHLGDAFRDINTENDGVLGVEHAGGQDLEDAREHRIAFGRILL